MNSIEPDQTQLDPKHTSQLNQLSLTRSGRVKLGHFKILQALSASKKKKKKQK